MLYVGGWRRDLFAEIGLTNSPDAIRVSGKHSLVVRGV